MSKRIYVGNLPWSTTSEELSELFRQYGNVTNSEVIIDRATGRSRGFGFIEMAVDSEAMSAIEALNGNPLNDRPLVVNEARDRGPRSGGGGGGGGRFGGGGRGGYDR